jgi:hypothetical protein
MAADRSGSSLPHGGNPGTCKSWRVRYATTFNVSTGLQLDHQALALVQVHRRQRHTPASSSITTPSTWW